MISVNEQFAKNKASDKNKIIAKVPEEDFIPYVCHYDPNTILTKNGELLQVIRITGFSSASAVAELISLRDAIRDALKNNIDSSKFALWFHTLRRKKDISPKVDTENGFQDFFSKNFNDEWVKKNQWDGQYVNELYITVVIEGLDVSIANFSSLALSLSSNGTKSMHQNFLKKSHEKLSSVVLNILKDIEDYGAKILGLKDWEGVIYSEPTRFFGKIANLCEERYLLVANDIAADLVSNKIAFGEREIEVIGEQGKNFAAIFSVKEYFETSIESIDRVLQLPFEFIITQSFDFSCSSKDLDPFKYQNYILQVSGDEEFRQMSGLANFIESKEGLPTDYGKLQTTFTIISHNREELEKDIKMALEQFNALGYVTVREDIFLEHCFWSQLPANFRFLSRQKVINTHQVAGFSILNSFPSGSIAANHWGPAISVLKTAFSTPYFFNFHNNDCGHTLILGPAGSGKTVLINLLLTQLRRIKSKIFYFDFNNKAKCFIKAISGSYYELAQEKIKDTSFLKLNPLSLPNKEENKNFLVDFFNSLIAFRKDSSSAQNPISQEKNQLILKVVNEIFSTNCNSLSSAIELFNKPDTAEIYEKLQIWKSEKLSYVFGATDEINWLDQTIAFDLTEINNHKAVLIPVVLYLLNRIEANLDGSPTVLVLQKSWELFDNVILAPRINDFLQRLKQKNCAAIFIAESDDSIGSSEISSIIKSQVVTEIFTPNYEPNDYYKNIFKISEDEVGIIKMMGEEDRRLLIKNSQDSVIINFDLSTFPEILKVFSADEITLAVMEEVITQIIAQLFSDPQDTSPQKKQMQGLDSKIWLEKFFEVMRLIEAERLEEEKERIKKEESEKRRLFKEMLEKAEKE